jgi:hypothetical protein
MFKAKLGELSIESLMLTSLAGVVNLGQNTLSTSNTRGEMTSTITAVDVAKVINYRLFSYNSEIWAGQADLGQLKLAVFLSWGGFREKSWMARFS